MKKMYLLILFCCLILVACGGSETVKSTPKPTPPVASKPTSKPFSGQAPAQTPTPSASIPATETTPNTPDSQIGDNSKKPGGYYLDDGPDANPPKNLDDIPNASPKNEPLLPRANQPYKALGQTYSPISTSQNYKERGIASWYGKRFNGKKTSSGEIYDMYSMSAAHTTLPLPSYVKVTNVANGRSVIVRVNDRGPFKSTRIIDLSYAAAYKLRLISQGSGMVEIEALHPDQSASNSVPAVTAEPAPSPVSTSPTTSEAISPAAQNADSAGNPAITGYFVQAGAFKNEANADALMKKIQSLEIEQNAGINRVYNNGLHRLKLGPYDNRQVADQVAASIRRQLNIATIITNQQ